MGFLTTWRIELSPRGERNYGGAPSYIDVRSRFRNGGSDEFLKKRLYLLTRIKKLPCRHYFYQFQENSYLYQQLADLIIAEYLPKYEEFLLYATIPPYVCGYHERAYWDKEYLSQWEYMYFSTYKNLEIIQEKAIELFGSMYGCDSCQFQFQKLPERIYDRGLVELARGNTRDAFITAEELIEHAKQHPGDALFKKSDLCLHLGLTFADALNYSKAIEYFSKAIELDPHNKQAYLERSIAYFETNQIDRALEDFKFLDTKQMLAPPKSGEKIQFGQAFLLGAHQGLADGFRELPSSLWYSLRGMGQLLWTSISNSLEVPKKIIEATTQIVDYLRTQDLKTISEDVAPEVAELVKNWDTYDSKTRGEKSGYILGKYGVSIFASCGSAKAISAYRELRRINALCSMETIASSQSKRNALCELSQKASKARAFGFANVQLSMDKQGKHIEGHRNYDPKLNFSILTHPNPEML